MKRLLKCLTLSVAAFALASMTPGMKGQSSGSFRITPDMLGLPEGNVRSAEPDEVRVYPAKSDGNADRRKGPVWIGSNRNPEHTMRRGETPAYHGCVDFTSRPGRGKDPEQLTFTAGVFGKVTDIHHGFIQVTLNNGIRIEYLHVSGAKVKKDAKVGPDTPLGVTGKELGASAIHLHIQAKDKDGRLIDPDRALFLGRIVPGVQIEPVDFGPILVDGKKPKVVDGVVKADRANKKLYYDETVPKKGVDIAGTTWVGVPREGADQVAGASDTWEFQEKGQLRFILKNDIDGERISQATWKQDGTSVTVKFDSGTVYTGVIKDDVITGEASWTHEGKKRTAPWRLKKR